MTNKTDIDLNGYLTISDLVRRTTLTKPVILRHIKAETFPSPVLVGKTHYWSKQEVFAWMHSRPKVMDPVNELPKGDGNTRLPQMIQ